MTLKRSEARILIFLKNTRLQFCYAKVMSKKLCIDYAYLRDVLGMMIEKDMILKTFDQKTNKAFYTLKPKGLQIMKQALKLVSGIVEEEE